MQQARGELAGAIEATRRTEDLVARTRKLAPEIVPELELFRAETELARRQKTELLARERWKVASAELLRVLRLDPSAQVEPLEPPQLRVELIDLKKPVDDLIPIALTTRPELASQQAQVQATLALAQTGALAAASSLYPAARRFHDARRHAGRRAFFAVAQRQQRRHARRRGPATAVATGQPRLRQPREGSPAAGREPRGGRRLFRIQDRVAAEVAQAYAQAQLAARRVKVAERGLRSAVQSADKNLVALRQTKGAGATLVLLVRPQEVVAAIQALAQAYADYYGAVADANRAQFRLYRALGQPAQFWCRSECRYLHVRPELLPDPALPAPRQSSAVPYRCRRPRRPTSAAPRSDCTRPRADATLSQPSIRRCICWRDSAISAAARNWCEGRRAQVLPGDGGRPAAC